MHLLFSEILDFGLANNESLANGMLEIAAAVVPYFAVAFFILTLFASLCSFVLLTKDKKVVGIDWTRSKPSFGLAALITSGMSIVSSFGASFLVGMLFNATVTIMPFLIIGKKEYIIKAQLQTMIYMYINFYYARA